MSFCLLFCEGGEGGYGLVSQHSLILVLFLCWLSHFLLVSFLNVQIFAGAFPENYVPPPGGFYYEVNDDSPIVQVKIMKTCY